jgi:carboxyl-terminal processing protease
MRRKSNFKSCTRDVANIIRNARVRGKIDGIILDMRGNGGGSLDEAVQLCGLFLQGRFPVVQQQGADRVNHLLYSENRAALYSGPLMVMVDHLSASAAEIAAACLQDCGRAVIVGSNTTFGKGTIQTLVDVEVPGVKGNAGAYKLTMGKFYRINGGATQEKGVIPDIIFPTFAEYMGYSEAKMPNVLPWDSTTPARYGVDVTMAPRIAKLKKLADAYMKQNANFLEYAGEVEKYRQLRERKQVPLEIGERREYREHEMRAIRQMRRYEPDRKSDDRPTLKGENDDLYEDKNAEKRDVILDTALQLMFNFVDISEKTGK